MNLKTANDLLQRYLKNECSSEEVKLVENWYQRLSETGDLQITANEKQQLKERMEEDILKRMSVEEEADDGGKVYKARFNWRKVWWAAAIFIVVLGAALVLFTQQPATKDPLVQKDLRTDVKAPVANTAMITLANGEQVTIDSALKGQLLLHGNMKLVKLPTGEITYILDSDVASEKALYSTVSNPYGSNVLAMQLPDGTKFWLNAGSSMTYPVVFADDERKVEITGEAYFEVAHNKEKPFRVVKGNTEVQVLGTHFNVNAYDDEDRIKVTLLEGSVNVNKAGHRFLLEPGQQAQIQDDIKIVDGVDTELVMAWKNGLFSFKGATLQEVMREIARWYNLKVVYEGAIPDRLFTGKIYRDNNLSDVLKILGENKIQYRLTGTEIVITK